MPKHLAERLFGRRVLLSGTACGLLMLATTAAPSCDAAPFAELGAHADPGVHTIVAPAAAGPLSPAAPDQGPKDDAGAPDEDGLSQAPPDAGPPSSPLAQSPDQTGANDDAMFADPQARAKLLNQLYDTLAHASDPEAAAKIDSAINVVWHRTGSPTIDLLLQHAELFEKKPNTDMALQILDAALDIAPDTAEAWHERAMVHLQRGEDAEALSDLHHALALDPKQYDAMVGLGQVLEQMGDKAQALAAYRRALSVNPFLGEARDKVEELTRQSSGQGI